MSVKVPAVVTTMAAELKFKHSMTLMVVGGAVRDVFFDRPSKDLDLVLFGANTPEAAREALAESATVTSVIKVIGKDGGEPPVFLVRFDDGSEADVAMARRETSTGPGTHDFEWVADATVKPASDAIRRDFTFNAIFWDIEREEFIDPIHGIRDAAIKRMDVPHHRTFIESPERVLRGAAAIARFDVDPSIWATALATDLRFDGPGRVPAEQKRRHFEKMFSGSWPDKGLDWLRDTGWLREILPEVDALHGVEQDPIWHPEGDVWTHTKQVVLFTPPFAGKGKASGFVLRLAALLHDIGKVSTTARRDDGRIISPGHADVGADMVPAIAKRFALSKEEALQVEGLVRFHMTPAHAIGPSGLRRLVNKLAAHHLTLVDLGIIMTADILGRGDAPWTKRLDALMAMLKMGEEMGVSEEPVEPLVKGRHLIALGMKPGKHFGDILRKAEQAQLDGWFDSVEDGIDWLIEEGAISLLSSDFNGKPLHIQFDEGTACGITSLPAHFHVFGGFTCQRCAKTEAGKLLANFDWEK